LHSDVTIVDKVAILAFAKNVLQKEIIKDTIMSSIKHRVDVVTVEINKRGTQNLFVPTTKKEAN
jgi:hypothetical protein